VKKDSSQSARDWKRLASRLIYAPRILMEAACACVLLGSCATAPRPSTPELPAEAAFNQGAGRGEPLVVKLRWKRGEEIAVMLDTGAGPTKFDHSLESKLGPRRGAKLIRYAYYGKASAGIYDAPRLYLGKTRLLMGGQVFTDQLARRDVPEGVVGILGMDCLSHYCLQFDFAGSRIRFLDPDHLDKTALGRPFPLKFWRAKLGGSGLFSRADFLGTGKELFLIDTGGSDGPDLLLRPKEFQRELRNQPPVFTLQGRMGTRSLSAAAGLSKVSIGGYTYTNLFFAERPGDAGGPAWNVIGLGFLARNLVTLDLPGRTMYLKQASVGPLEPGLFLGREAMEFLFHLSNEGKLPGILKNEQWDIHNIKTEPPPATGSSSPAVSILFEARKEGDTQTHHYMVESLPQGGRWKLQRAWRTGQGGRLLEEYRLP
jgi:hypothetical protein